MVKLILVIDVSGSMNQDGRLPLVNRFLTELSHIGQKLHEKIPKVSHEVLLYTFADAVKYHGEYKLKEFNKQLSASGGTNMIESLQTGFLTATQLVEEKNKKNVVFFFYLTDNTTAFTTNPELQGLVDHYHLLENKSENLTVAIGINIHGEKAGPLAQLFKDYYYVENQESLQKYLDEILNLFLKYVQTDSEVKETTETIAKVTKNIETNQKAYAKCEEKVKDEFAECAKIKTEIDKEIKIMKEDILPQINDLKTVLTDFSQLPVFLTGTDEERNVFFNHHINLHQELKKKQEEVEQKFSLLQGQLKGHGENVLKILETDVSKLNSQMQGDLSVLNGFCINISKLGPHIKEVMLQLKNQKGAGGPGAQNELQMKQTEIAMKGKINGYKSFVQDEIKSEVERLQHQMSERAAFIEKCKAEIRNYAGDKNDEVFRQAREALVGCVRLFELVKQAMDRIATVNIDF